MKIAQVSPLIESVPPHAYGGTERIVSYLTEQLVENGHNVTLFATADSQTKAKLIPIGKIALRLDPECFDPLIYHYIELAEILKRSSEFDIIHFHIDYLHYPVSRQSDYKHITTLHGRQDINGLDKLYEQFSDIPLISISNHQRTPLPKANWIDTIYHGIPSELYLPKYSDGKYLAFLGRISHEKRVDRAIEIARRTGIPLKIAAKIDKNDKEYYESIKHLFAHPLVEYLGEIQQHEKNEFLANAIALLFPIDWPEPFGLVMIESMAAGTPVIAFKNGSVTEVVDEGATGFTVLNIAEAVDAVKKIETLDRRKCRATFEKRFTVEIMTQHYERIYRTLIQKNKTQAFTVVN